MDPAQEDGALTGPGRVEPHLGVRCHLGEVPQPAGSDQLVAVVGVAGDPDEVDDERLVGAGLVTAGLTRAGLMTAGHARLRRSGTRRVYARRGGPPGRHDRAADTVGSVERGAAGALRRWLE